MAIRNPHPGGYLKPPATPPIVIGCYTLLDTGLLITGRPSFAEHEGVGEFIKRANRSSGWWLADWLRYGESRTEWKRRLSQVVDATGLSEKRMKNVRAIGAIELSRRRDGVEFELHAEVAALSPEEQSAWLEQTEREGWDRRELRLNMRAARRRKVLEGQARLEGMFRVLYADPPWLYGDNGPTEDGSLGKAERHYAGLTIEELCQLPVAAHALPNAVLFMWITAPLLLQHPGPREVIEAWGFTAKTGLVWDKVLGNFGHYVHVQHEHLVICTRGSCLPDVPTPQPPSVLRIRRSDRHSEKPPEARHLIEQLYTTGPYLELFGRERVKNWAVFGDDARLWPTDVQQQEVTA